MIGASLSFCVKHLLQAPIEVDVVIGFEKLEMGISKAIYRKEMLEIGKVEKIIAATRATSKEDWDRIYAQYCQTYWADNPDGCCGIADALMVEGKIKQPRVDGKECHHISYGVWYDTEKLFWQAQDFSPCSD
jgi:hypothetical protein